MNVVRRCRQSPIVVHRIAKPEELYGRIRCRERHHELPVQTGAERGGYQAGRQRPCGIALGLPYGELALASLLGSSWREEESFSGASTRNQAM